MNVAVKMTLNSGLKNIYAYLTLKCTLFCSRASFKSPNSFFAAAVIQLPIRGWLYVFSIVPL